MDMVQRGYVIVDASRGRDETAERDSLTRPFKTVKAAFAQVADNDTVRIYPGVYTETPVYDANWASLAMCGAAFGLVNKKNVTIEGIGWPEIRIAAHANGMVLFSCTNCRMTGMKFSGLGYMRKGPGHYYALVLLHGVNRGHHFDNNVFADSGDHLLAHLSGPRTVFDSKVTNCRFYRTGQMIPGSPWPDGVAVGFGGYGNTVAGNYFEECNRCVEVESGEVPNDGVEAINISIVDNKIYHPWSHPIMVTPMLPDKVYGKLIISRNHIQGWGRDPKPDFGGHWAPLGIWLTGAESALITENVFSDLWDACAVQLEAAACSIRNVIVANNLFNNIGRSPVSMTQPVPGVVLEFCQVHHNQIRDCQGRAIWVQGSYNTIESNVIINSDYAGLFEQAGRWNIWRGNRLFDCGGAQVPGQAPDGPVKLLNYEQIAWNDIKYINKTPPIPGNGSN